MKQKDADVVIVGAGLAGSATAIHLARAGRRVLLIDKTLFPRDKPCGEGLLPNGTKRLCDLGLPWLLDEIEAPSFRGILYRGFGVEACGDFQAGEVGRGVRRTVLDARVQAAALAAGDVSLETGQVVGVETGPVVRLMDGRCITASVVVGADGMRSRVRRAIGLDVPPAKTGRYALRRHFELADGNALPTRVEVNAVPGYELYLTPAANRVVGVAALVGRDVMRHGRGDGAERMAALIGGAPAALRERLAGSRPVSAALACGPLRVRTKGISRDRVVLVGDAAGYVDAITGEGMSLALATAEMAARACVAVLGGCDPDLAFARYATQRKSIFDDHKWLTLGLLWLTRRPRIARRCIARLAVDPALFTRLLAVNNGTARIRDLRSLDFLKLALGTSPRRALP